MDDRPNEVKLKQDEAVKELERKGSAEVLFEVLFLDFLGREVVTCRKAAYVILGSPEFHFAFSCGVLLCGCNGIIRKFRATQRFDRFLKINPIYVETRESWVDWNKKAGDSNFCAQPEGKENGPDHWRIYPREKVD